MSGLHTAGPWKAEGEMVSAHHAAGDPRLEYWICEEVNGDRRAGATSGRPSDNARLIAASPTLLSAAQRVTAAFRALGMANNFAPNKHQACEAAMLALDAAINEATGATP